MYFLIKSNTLLAERIKQQIKRLNYPNILSIRILFQNRFSLTSSDNTEHFETSLVSFDFICSTDLDHYQVKASVSH